MNVLVCDPISSEGVAVLQQCEGLNVIVLEKRPTESELISMVSDVNAIVVRSETKITRSVISAAATSTLSTPTPARPTAFSLPAAEITLRVN